jgi:dTDP-4-amino-4,6-dideoxygalactose transaminase
MIYYPIPAHRQGMFSSFDLGHVQLPITDQLTAQVISLPIHTEMQADQQSFIINSFLDILKS